MVKTATYERMSDAEKVVRLESRVDSLEHTLAWFQQQVFGRKSEKRVIEPPANQPLLNGFAPHDGASNREEAVKKVAAHERRGTKKRSDACVTDSGLRFDDTVPVEEVRLSAPELEGADAANYIVVDEHCSYRLAQRPGSYVVLKYVTPVVKNRQTLALSSPLRPPALWQGSMADVSMVAGLLTEKFVYHMPLYRQHQRLARDGITVSRQTLTHWAHRSIDLLAPIVEAMHRSVLQSKVLAIDETPCKAGRDRPSKGKMKVGWYWPIYGEHDEVVFTFSYSRGHQHLLDVLDGYTGTILSDGHGAYTKFVDKCKNIEHAQCWTHCRREFVKAEKSEPEVVAEALERIGKLYQAETHIREQHFGELETLAWRNDHSRPALNAFFDWCRDIVQQRTDLVPSAPLSKAFKYALKREQALQVYLTNPGVAIDTNHLERTLRVIPMGRKSWMFNWTEVGAEYVGIIQSLMTTCRLHGINPYHYLVDVLQRVGEHPASRVEELTPRNWKRLFADNSIRSDLHRATCK